MVLKNPVRMAYKATKSSPFLNNDMPRLMVFRTSTALSMMHKSASPKSLDKQFTRCMQFEPVMEIGCRENALAMSN